MTGCLCMDTSSGQDRFQVRKFWIQDDKFVYLTFSDLIASFDNFRVSVRSHATVQRFHLTDLQRVPGEKSFRRDFSKSLCLHKEVDLNKISYSG